MRKLYRILRYWFYSWGEDPKYRCFYDDVVQGAYARGHRNGMEMQRAIEEMRVVGTHWNRPKER